MADLRRNNSRESYFLSTFDTSNNRENHSLHQARPPISREPDYVHNSGAFDRHTNLNSLEREFHRFTKINKPRHIKNYFIGEFERLKHN